MKMASNKKNLNYKVVDLVERYNFHIKFTSIGVQTKKTRLPTAVGDGGRCMVLQNFLRTIFFLQN
jgi:hypothetical protein